MTVDLKALHQSFDAIPSAFATARDSIDVLLGDRGWRRTTPEDTVEALMRGARAAAVLASPEPGASGYPAGQDARLAGTKQDAIRVSTMVLGQAPTFRDTPLQALAQVHAMAAATTPREHRGRPRDSESAHRLQRLGALLRANAGAPALVVAAIVHAEIAAGEPFASHNCLVACAAERLTLVARGVDPASVLVPEAGHFMLRESYDAALAAYRAGGLAVGHGAGEWLRHAAAAYVAGIEASPLHANGTQTNSGAAAHT
ncbi:MAG: oxidoreductase [Nocardioides sp.]